MVTAAGPYGVVLSGCFGIAAFSVVVASELKHDVDHAASRRRRGCSTFDRTDRP